MNGYHRQAPLISLLTLIMIGFLLSVFWGTLPNKKVLPRFSMIDRGHSQADSRAQAVWYQVVGSSMAPTLFGECAHYMCEGCTQHNLFFLYQDGVVSERQLKCFHCKNPFHNTSSFPKYAGDRVQVKLYAGDHQVDRRGVKRGRLVAVKHSGQIHVKRVVGLPGETVDTSGLHLTVNQNRIEDLLYHAKSNFVVPWVLVSHDSAPKVTPWESVSSSGRSSQGWKRSCEGLWISEAASSDWLVYSPGLHPAKKQDDPIWDDLPFNIGNSRKLFPVDRLRISGVSLNDAVVKFQFWTTECPRQLQRNLAAGESFSLSCYDASELSKEDKERPMVAMNRPLAISCANGIARLDEIKVERLIEYRMRPHDKNQYPITLGESEYYLLGDNVPLSMDSREWGPMPEALLIGEIDQFSRTIK